MRTQTSIPEHIKIILSDMIRHDYAIGGVLKVDEGKQSPSGAFRRPDHPAVTMRVTDVQHDTIPGFRLIGNLLRPIRTHGINTRQMQNTQNGMRAERFFKHPALRIPERRNIANPMSISGQ